MGPTEAARAVLAVVITRSARYVGVGLVILGLAAHARRSERARRRSAGSRMGFMTPSENCTSPLRHSS
jgi:hypothetical protein